MGWAELLVSMSLAEAALLGKIYLAVLTLNDLRLSLVKTFSVMFISITALFYCILVWYGFASDMIGYVACVNCFFC